ncbi:MAG: Eco57I restriction-modification methylase domain-containing protein [Candidatus Competibacter sp.]|nr:Eco57I restriction-modification methylase domain-containing protein [Candidatus Competibacter sp.]
MPAATAAESKERIQSALGAFASQPLPVAARALFGVLGYFSSRDERVLPITSPEAFLNWLEAGGRLAALSAGEQEEFRASLTRLHFLFQLTDAEMKAALGQAVQTQLFDSGVTVDGSRMESYLVFAAELAAGVASTRTVLARLVRLFNKPLPMPALVLFRHGDTLTLGVIKRRLNLRDAARDVLERVTLIKDIRFASPHRAHVEILFDLSLSALHAHYQPASFVKLHEAWQKTLDIQTLNRRFFIEIRNWFYWARLHARFPAGAAKDEGGDSESLIRLLTRLIFCWFLTEKGLIPNQLFSERFVSTLLCDWPAAAKGDTEGRYYKAILQNLFFATLNTPVAERKFRTAHTFQGRNRHYGDQRYFRHVALFEETAPVEALYRSIPFLNGGLFEMLDEIPGRGDPGITQEKRVDGFSDVPGKQPLVPDFLFFGEERPVPEIAALLGESATPRARGLFRIFHDYKFTIEENTPLEEDIALDPELLGRAFENLLAAINPETGAVARKSTGSFYTPREIVNYMVEEALVRRLLAVLEEQGSWPADVEERLCELVSIERESHRFSDDQAAGIVEILGQLRILDPACGSGAFPMGLLQRLVQVLRKLDPGNERWKAAKLATLPLEMREKAEQVFREESFDYTRKLELIKDCIHGVDIQPAAIQISKLRFFLSLVIEQKSHHAIRPLPNLETKFVCANALLGLPRRENWASLFAKEIEPKERALLDVRARYFFCVSQKEKEACRAEDRRLRQELSDFIKAISGSGAPEFAFAVAAWDPYKPDRVAGYFDPETMFGVVDGFDITIGNPPYVRADEQSERNRRQREQILASGDYETLWEKWDLFVPFIERAYKLLKPGGISTLIVSDAYCHSKYAQKSQNWFLKNARVSRLDFCSKLQIFEAAVHNLICFFQKADGANNCPERRVHETVFGQVSLLPTNEQPKLTYRAFFPEHSQHVDFSKPILPIGDICYVSFGCRPNSDEKIAKGLFVVADLLSDKYDNNHPKPYIEAKDINRWTYDQTRWLEWGTERSPLLLARPTFENLYEVQEKIVAADVSGAENRAAYDPCKVYHSHTLISFVPWHHLHGVQNNSLKKAARYRGEKPRPDLPCREELEATSRRFSVKYLLGVMNSSAARDFLRAHRRSNIHLYPDDWKKLPIPVVSPEQQAPIVALVDEILTLRRANPQADIAGLEAEIDRNVAGLYGIVPQ